MESCGFVLVPLLHSTTQMTSEMGRKTVAFRALELPLVSRRFGFLGYLLALLFESLGGFQGFEGF